MAHAARIDKNGLVLQVVVVDDDEFVDAKGNKLGQKLGTFPEDELLVEYMTSIGLHKDDGLGETWRFTSYNNNFRSTYAGKGFMYDKIGDVFVPPETLEIPKEEES